MKLKNLLLAALAASTTLAACDKSENSNSPNPDKMPKSVTITLPNINPESRATGDAIAHGTAVELKNFKVYFVNASNTEVDVPEYEGSAQKTYYTSTDTDWAEKTAAGSELTYHFLPYETAKVVVVGNIGGDVAYEALASLVMDVPNDDAAGHPAYPLYGEDDLVEGGAPDDADHQNVYKASVTLQPRVSRFEIYGFEYQAATAPATNKYTSVDSKRIALNHFYTKYDFVTKEPVEDSGVFEDPGAEVAWSWIENRPDWCDDLTLNLNAGDKKFANGDDITDPNEKGDNATGIITYGLANVEDKAKNPELLLALHGNPATGAAEPLYLRGIFTNKAPFVSGKIYRVFFTFNDDDLKQPQRCVKLSVTVDNWTVVPVTPEF